MRIKPIALVLVALAAVLMIIGILYLTQTTTHLPSFMPGKPSGKALKLICSATNKKKGCHEARHFTKRGIAALGLGVVVLVGAWYTSGLRKSSSSSSHSA